MPNTPANTASSSTLCEIPYFAYWSCRLALTRLSLLSLEQDHIVGWGICQYNFTFLEVSWSWCPWYLTFPIWFSSLLFLFCASQVHFSKIFGPWGSKKGFIFLDISSKYLTARLHKLTDIQPECIPWIIPWSIYLENKNLVHQLHHPQPHSNSRRDYPTNEISCAYMYYVFWAHYGASCNLHVAWGRCTMALIDFTHIEYLTFPMACVLHQVLTEPTPWMKVVLTNKCGKEKFYHIPVSTTPWGVI